MHTKPVFGLSVEQTVGNLFSTAGEDGKVFIFDIRTGSAILSVPKSRYAFHAVQFHPLCETLLATANSNAGAALWELRTLKMYMHIKKF